MPSPVWVWIPLMLVLGAVVTTLSCREDEADLASLDRVEDRLQSILAEVVPAIEASDSVALHAGREKLIELRIQAGKLEPGPDLAVLKTDLLEALDSIAEAVDAAIRAYETSAAGVSDSVPGLLQQRRQAPDPATDWRRETRRAREAEAQWTHCQRYLQRALDALARVHEARGEILARSNAEAPG